jgi:uncharacterized Ntn-hydrolase superfamily protein
MTFSIVALDRKSGALGVAVTTGVACVGALAPHVSERAAISTQAFVNVDLALRALHFIDLGMSLPAALDLVLEEDERADMRQVIGIGRDGRPFAHTGTQPLVWAGHQVHEDHVVAGNSLKGEVILDAVSAAYGDGGEHEFTLRLIKAIEAGQRAGGERDVEEIELHVDNSAAVIVSSPAPRAFHNLRVDAATDAVAELLRVYHAAVASAEAMEAFYKGAIVLRPTTWRLVREPLCESPEG